MIRILVQQFEGNLTAGEYYIRSRQFKIKGLTYKKLIRELEKLPYLKPSTPRA